MCESPANEWVDDELKGRADREADRPGPGRSYRAPARVGNHNARTAIAREVVRGSPNRSESVECELDQDSRMDHASGARGWSARWTGSPSQTSCQLRIRRCAEGRRRGR